MDPRRHWSRAMKVRPACVLAGTATILAIWISMPSLLHAQVPPSRFRRPIGHPAEGARRHNELAESLRAEIAKTVGNIDSANRKRQSDSLLLDSTQETIRVKRERDSTLTLEIARERELSSRRAGAIATAERRITEVARDSGVAAREAARLRDVVAALEADEQREEGEVTTLEDSVARQRLARKLEQTRGTLHERRLELAPAIERERQAAADADAVRSDLEALRSAQRESDGRVKAAADTVSRVNAELKAVEKRSASIAYALDSTRGAIATLRESETKMRAEWAEHEEKAFVARLPWFVLMTNYSVEDQLRILGDGGFNSFSNIVINGWNDRGSVYTDVFSGNLDQIRFVLGVSVATAEPEPTTTEGETEDDAEKASPAEESALQNFMASGGTVSARFEWLPLFADIPGTSIRTELYLVQRMTGDFNALGKTTREPTWNAALDADLLVRWFFMKQKAAFFADLRGGVVAGTKTFFRNIDWEYVDAGAYWAQLSLGLRFTIEKTEYAIMGNFPLTAPDVIWDRVKGSATLQIIPWTATEAGTEE